MAEIQRYRDVRGATSAECREDVLAFKIKSIDVNPDGSGVLWSEEGVDPELVKATYMNSCKPIVGGYYLVYPDSGWQRSFIAAEDFEAGYTKI